MIEFQLDETELRQLGEGARIRLVLDVQPDGSIARLRADDTIQINLQGDFNFEVKVGGN